MAESTNAVKKWIWTVIVGCVGVILLFLIFLPTILSSDAGTRFLIRRVENQTGGTLTVRNLQLSWLGEQKIDALQFQEGKGFLLTFDTLTSDCSFWNLLFRRGSVGKTQINNLHISAYPKVSEEKVAALKEVGKKAKKPKGEFWSDFRGHLILSNGRVTIQNGVSIYAINVNLELDKTSAFKVEGKARRNEQLGNFYGEGKQSPLWEGGMTFTNVPVEGLDQIVALIRPKSQGLLLALLGDTINAQLQSIPTPEGLSLACDVNSPRLRVDLKPTYQEGVFRLETPGRIALTVKPLLFNTFSKEVVLQNDAQTELRIEKASLPLMKQKLNLAKGSGEGNLYFSKGQLLLTQVQEILEVNELNANFSTSALGELINLTLRSAMRYQKEAPSSVNGTLAIQNLLKKPTFPQLDLNIQNLPLALIDSFNKSSLVTYLGNTYSGKVVKSENQFTVSGKTPLLSLEKTSLKIDTNAVLTEPANFSYQITPKLYKELARPFPVQGIIHTLLLPLSKEGLVFKKANFNLTLNAGAIESKNLLGLGAASLPSLQATLQGTSLESAQFAISTFLDYHEQTWGYAILGDQVGVKASGRASFDKELEVSPLDLSIDGRKFKGDIAAAIEKHTLILKKGIQVNFLLEPSQLNPILSKDNAYPLLVKTTPLELQIKPSQIPLKEETLSALSVKGVGKVADLEMVNPANRYPFNFKDVEIDFDLDGKKNSHTIHFEGEALENQQKAGKLTLALSGTGKASELITSPDTVKASLSSFSSQIADVFFKTRGQLPDLIGPTLNLNYEMGKVGDRQQLDMQIDSPGLTLDGAFYGGKNLELRSPRKPLRIRWDLSEKSYDAFRRWRSPNQQLASNNPLFQIEGTGVLKIQVSPFSIPLKDQGEGFPKPEFQLFGSRFDAAVQIDGLKLKHGQTGAVAELEKFTFDISKDQVGSNPLTFDFDGNVTPFGKGKSGVVQGRGTIKDFLSPQGALDFKDVTTSIHARVRNLPTIFVDALSKFDQASGFPPSAFLGDLFNATFDAEVEKSQGKITMDVDASACRASFAGIVSDGTLYLHDPLKAAFTITPQLNNVLEKSAKLVVVAMEKPVTLYIHDEGFHVPLKNLHIRNMSFKYGQLDLGQIICQNVGSTSAVGGLFKSKDRGNVSLWFAPADFSMNRGNVYVDRTEVLYNHAYQVCLWGDVFFPRRTVDMTLGLTAQALRSALGIQGIDDNYVLKVPVEGPFGNVQIDTASATAKIAFLVAQKHIAPQTGIWGQVLGAVGSLADDQSDVPPPKPPFPWQARP